MEVYPGEQLESSANRNEGVGPVEFKHGGQFGEWRYDILTVIYGSARRPKLGKSLFLLAITPHKRMVDNSKFHSIYVRLYTHMD